MERGAHVDESALRFSSICRRNGLPVSDQQLEKLGQYVQLLQDWNTKLNLVSRGERKDIWTAHILHSISPLFLLDIQPALRVLDLGTGGGLPGIPLAIVRPDLQVMLVDSIRKKIAAVQDILARLSLPNVGAVASRVEDLPRTSGFEHFDIVVARGVAPLVELVRWSRLLLRDRPAQPQGTHSTDARALRLPCLIAYKGGDLTSEVQALTRRFPRVSVDIRNIVFDGSSEIDLTEKKLVIVTKHQKPL
jgi:16S rRNA (guanine527-N7)-methyltransferase